MKRSIEYFRYSNISEKDAQSRSNFPLLKQARINSDRQSFREGTE